MDVLSPAQRALNMSRIRGTDTRPEMLVRRWLWKNGYRYRLHCKSMPGKPDIVLGRYHAVLFIHGCFWHRHGCRMTTTPATRKEFWLNKFQENIRRDRKSIASLQASGWRVMVIWECCVRGKTDFEIASKQILSFLQSDTPFMETGKTRS